MCGLSGAAGSLTFKEEKVVKTLLIWNQVRGDDATGIGSVKRSFNKDVPIVMDVAKETGPPYFLFDTNRFNKVFGGNNKVFIGHNRSKTTGDSTRKSAHPFLFEHVMGAHNGTVDHQNKGRMKDGHTFRTDSEAILNNIQELGIEDTVSKLDDSEAYALTWYDSRDNTINMIRNDKRPLIYVYTKEQKALFWASEYPMLYAALLREDVKPDSKFFILPTNTHFSWEVPEFESQAFKDPVRKRLETRKTVYAWQNNSHFNNQQSKKNYNTETNSKTTTTTGTGTCSAHNPYGMSEEELELWEYGGPYVGMVAKQTYSVSPEKVTTIVVEPEKVKPGFNAALEAVDKGLQRLKGVVNSATTTVEHVAPAVVAAGINRLKAWDRFVKAELEPVTSEVNRKFYDSNNLKVWRNISTFEWEYCKYNTVRDEWELYSRQDRAPEEMPYTLVDINSRHMFKHKGKKKNKRIFYKGYGRTYLDREVFDNIMKEGCEECLRVPEWGNEVTFVSENHKFLCEFCALTPPILNQYLKAEKEKVQKAA